MVGEAADREQLCSWSGPLGAAVVVLPGAAGLADHVDGRRRPTPTGSRSAGRGARRVRRSRRLHLCGRVGGGGGPAGAAYGAGRHRSARRRPGPACSAPKQAPAGAGPGSSGARGHLGDLSGQLPYVDGVDLLSAGRGEDTDAGPPGAAQLQAVLRSTSRSHELTVVDLPRAPDWIAREVSRHADLFLLVVRADVRGVSAARAVIDQFRDGPRPEVLVRTRRAGPLTATAVAEGLGASLLGTMADDNSVRVAAERGDPPGRAARSALAVNAVGRSSGGCRPRGRRDRGGGQRPTELDPVRGRLAGPRSTAHAGRRGRGHAGRGSARQRRGLLETVDRLRQDSVGAGPLEKLLREPAGHRRAGERAGPGLRGPGIAVWNRRRCGSPTTPRSVGWLSGWPPASGVGSTTPRPSSMPDCPTAPGCTPSLGIGGCSGDLPVPPRSGGPHLLAGGLRSRWIGQSGRRRGAAPRGGASAGLLDLRRHRLGQDNPPRRLARAGVPGAAHRDRGGLAGTESGPPACRADGGASGQRRAARRDHPDRPGPAGAADAPRPVGGR